MKSPPEQALGIGSVVRQTGIPAQNIRMWEKRYSAVVPERTPSNRRLYSPDDLKRLGSMKKLTESGHAISQIANLTNSQLHELLENEPRTKENETLEANSPRIVAIGLRESFFEKAGDSLKMKMVANYETIDVALSSLKEDQGDLLIIEVESLFPEAVASLRKLVEQAGSPPSILIYRYTATQTAAALARSISGMTVLKAPVTDSQLHRECLVRLSKRDSTMGSFPDKDAPIPDRLYTTQELSYLAGLSSTVKCECPQHLAELLQSLSAFENYSKECEDRSPEDAVLHDLLHRVTAGVRRQMEEVLSHVVQAEGIALG